MTDELISTYKPGFSRDFGDTEAPLTQGGAREFGHVDEAAVPVGSLVILPTALECLLSVVEKHGGALAKGSALLGGLQVCRVGGLCVVLCMRI